MRVEASFCSAYDDASCRHLETQAWIFLLSVRKLAKFIDPIDNFCNFILEEHSDNRFKVIFEHYKVNTFIAILLISK